MKVLLALGGNAMTNADGPRPPGGPDRRRRGRDGGRRRPASPTGVDVVVTHGNGPQVGNLLVKNELAAAVVPPVPLDWCGAQTQATLGFVLMDALDAALAAPRRRPAHGRPGHPHARRPPTTPASPRPTKPIGRYLPGRGGAPPRRPRRDLGGPRREGLAPRGRLARAARGPRRPRRARAGRRGLRRRRQRRRRHPGRPRGRRLAARRRGRHRQGPRRRAARPAPSAPTCWSSPPTCPRRARATARPRPTPSAGSTVAEMRAYAAEGHFASGSMGPKVEAACRFVEHGGARAVITDLDQHRRRGRRATPAPSSYPTQEAESNPMPERHRGPQGPDPLRRRRVRARRSSSTTA